MRAAMIRSAVLTLAFAGVAACAHTPSVDDEVQHDPIPLHVINENYLDMNVSVNAGGTRRRLGTVPGNSSGDFMIDWSLADGRQITVLATPIGGNGSASSGALSVGYGEAIDFKVGLRLIQSVATVHSR
jgi:hypothetical protein